MGGWQMFRDGSVLEPGVIAQMIRYLGALRYILTSWLL